MKRKLIFLLYRSLLVAAFPLIVLYVIARGLRDRRYLRHLRERFGFLPASHHRTTHDAIWLHAVSVGEVLSAMELLKRLRMELPDSSLFVSCGTVSGRKLAASKLTELVDGVFYAPFDYALAVRRVLRTIKPAVVLVLETEIWPNLYREVKRARVGLLVVNGRISSKAFPRYRRHRWFFSQVLALPDRILVQSETDHQRYLAAGAPPETVRVAGNLKYDFDPNGPATAGVIEDFLRRNKKGAVWVAASTVAPEYSGDVDEDDVVIAAYQSLGEVLLVLAPRKPERFDAVAEKLKKAGMPFVRRSELTAETEASVLLLDSIGELGSLFRFADAVFVGGTLADRGGHNILEPALYARPIIVGPHLENFADIQSRFRAAEGFLEITSPAELTGAVERLLRDRQYAAHLGARAQALAEAERGATKSASEAAVSLRWCYVPCTATYGPFHGLLRLLSLLWQTAGRWKRRTTQEKRLQTPVISIGGLAMGGVGKTPFVAYLARRLREEQGRNPAILTRGYRRKKAEAITVLAAGERAPVSRTGEEAQILLQRGIAPVGIGSNRWMVGLEMEKRFRPDVFLLDDGFQHARLHRDVDIVLLDGLDPLGGGAVFPLGRLREAPEALQRASAIVITRSEGRQYDGLVEYLRAIGVLAPIFRSTVEPMGWRDRNGAVAEFRFDEAFAFCGLGNPAAFWSTLCKLGIKPLAHAVLPDHHIYSEADLTSLNTRAHHVGAKVLLTTEKDAVNLPSSTFGLPIYWLAIDVAVENEPALLSLLR